MENPFTFLARRNSRAKLTSGVSRAQPTPSTACLYWARMSRSARVKMTSPRRNELAGRAQQVGFVLVQQLRRRLGRHERHVEDLQGALLVGKRLSYG